MDALVCYRGPTTLGTDRLAAGGTYAEAWASYADRTMDNSRIPVRLTVHAELLYPPPADRLGGVKVAL
jgi:hypothetical protein